jgi:cytochrome c5
MNSNRLSQAVAAIVLLYSACSMAAAWEENIKQVDIPGGLAANRLPDSQSSGAKLFAQYCSKCHNLPSPRMHAATDWPARFEKMMDHVNLLAGAAPGIKMPADGEKKEIVAYLQKNGFVGLATYAPLLAEPEGFNVAWFCSACHAVPDPIQFPAKGATQFSAKEWGMIVDRMNAYRKNQGREAMSDADRKGVVDFLTKKR